MKVFISWSGETSKAIASLLRKYLPIMLQQVRPFMSRHDIITGSRWSERIQEELEEASFGIIVLTPSNLSAKWLLFEAGAISKLKNSGTACLLCAGVEDTAIVGPLQQFQFQRFEKEPFFKLVRDMNQRTANPLLDESVTMILEKWWADIDTEYKKSVKEHHAKEVEQKDPRNEREFQDEILKTLRVLANRTESSDVNEPSYEDDLISHFLIYPSRLESLVGELLSMYNVKFLTKPLGSKTRFLVSGQRKEVEKAVNRVKTELA